MRLLQTLQVFSFVFLVYTKHGRRMQADAVTVRLSRLLSQCREGPSQHSKLNARFSVQYHIIRRSY